MKRISLSGAALCALFAASCSGKDGAAGAAGERGAMGERGANGQDGQNGQNGQNGTDGEDGMNGQNGQNGTNGVDGEDGMDGFPGAPGYSPGTASQIVRAPGIDPSTPLSSLVSLVLATSDAPGQPETIPAFVRSLVDRTARGSLGFTQFPVPSAATDSVRTLRGLHASVVVKWLDPLVFDGSANAIRYGANNDYVAYFGDGWDSTPGAPNYRGRGDAGWIWVNHEYISGNIPTLTAPPTSQYLILAKYLRHLGVLSAEEVDAPFAQADLDRFVVESKKNHGGSWIRIIKDEGTGTWSVDRRAANKRYDSTSGTLLRLTGTALQSGLDHLDDGTALPENVVAGIVADCSGAQTPWGTVISAEENSQGYYGDMEACWDGNQRFIAGRGCDAGGPISLTVAPSTNGAFGQHSDPNQLHARDIYGYLVEIDPGVDPSEYEGRTSPGVGHKKLGSFGRARWENAAIAVGQDWNLTDNQPIVMYAGDDKRSGRIYKWVSTHVWRSSMTRAETRALLDEGSLYVAHFADLSNETGLDLLSTGSAPTETNRGQGRWIELSVDNLTDDAPNATALGRPGLKVGEALTDPSYNSIGGFPTNDEVRRTLFTASNKIGVMELNRPEDIEWNPRSPSGVPQIFVAFTNHARRVALDQSGVVYDPATHSTTAPTRPDPTGAVFVIEEAAPNDPGTSTTFTFFEVWRGTQGDGHFDAANPDNIAIDAEGGVWFGTDGNFGTNGASDAIYYLDLDPAHRAGQPGVVDATYGKAFRVVSAAADAEATGPAFSADMRTLFYAVQHPGEDVFSVWP